MSSPTARSLTGLLSTLLALSVFAGCGLTAKQKSAVGEFSSSAATLGTVTSQQMLAMRDATIRMNTERLLLDGKSKDSQLADQQSLDRGFDMERVQIITGATDALAAYGSSLNALVDDTQSAQLKSATEKFLASLDKVPAAKATLDSGKSEAIGTVIVEVGGMWIDSKRKKAVETIVRSSDQTISALCDQLARDFDPKTGWVALQLMVTEAPLMAAATNALYDGHNYDDRSAALDAFEVAHRSRMSRVEVVGRVKDSAMGMKRANMQLVAAINDKSWSMQDIRDFAEKAQSLATAVKTISSTTEVPDNAK